MRYGESLPREIEEAARQVVDAAYKVHLHLGAGLLESVYEVCLAHELRKRGLRVRRQVVVPIFHDGVELDEGFRMDLLVEECLIVEVKAVDQITPICGQQLLTYLKLTKLRLGLLINFDVAVMSDGIKRVIRSR